jgi:hypothetical protein
MQRLPAGSFQDLIVWQKSASLCSWRLSRKQKVEEVSKLLGSYSAAIRASAS